MKLNIHTYINTQRKDINIYMFPVPAVYFEENESSVCLKEYLLSEKQVHLLSLEDFPGYFYM